MKTLSLNRKAFTLVELLVVIAIIGLLSTVAIMATGSARRQSRNAKRIADIKQLVTAFNVSLNTGATGVYPSSGGDVWACISSACTTGWVGFTANGTVDAFFTPYMPTKPTDPPDANARGQGGYLYNGAWVGSGSFSAGVYISYLLESPASCGAGSFFGSGSGYIQCMVKLD